MKDDIFVRHAKSGFCWEQYFVYAIFFSDANDKVSVRKLVCNVWESAVSSRTRLSQDNKLHFDTLAKTFLTISQVNVKKVFEIASRSIRTPIDDMDCSVFLKTRI